MKLPKIRGKFTGVYSIMDMSDVYMSDRRTGAFYIDLEYSTPYFIDQVDGTTLKVYKNQFTCFPDGFMTKEAAEKKAKAIIKFLSK